MEKKITEPGELPEPSKNPEIIPDIPENPVTPEEPEIMPGIDPYETPPVEIPINYKMNSLFY